MIAFLFDFVFYKYKKDCLFDSLYYLITQAFI